MACIKRFSKMLVNSMYLTIIFFSVLFTFAAVVYDKFDFASDIVTYAIIYGLVFIPPVALNTIASFSVNKHDKHAVSFGDGVLLTVCAGVLLVFALLGSKHDLKFIIPWCLMLLIDLAYIVIRQYINKKATAH